MKIHSLCMKIREIVRNYGNSFLMYEIREIVRNYGNSFLMYEN
jgi:hypothetical protein